MPDFTSCPGTQHTMPLANALFMLFLNLASAKLQGISWLKATLLITNHLESTLSSAGGKMV